MERAPGLAPGKSGFADRRLDDFGIARVWFWKWGDRPVLPRFDDLHRIGCWLLHHGLHLKLGSSGRCRPGMISFTRGVHCLVSATEELERMALPRGVDAPASMQNALRGVLKTTLRVTHCTSSFRLRRAACRTITPRELKVWCAMPVLPRRQRIGRPPCYLLHQ